VPADFATIFYGDGTSSCKDGVPRFGGRRPIPGNTDTSVNIYYFEHTYPTIGLFIVSYIGENRNQALNIDRPLEQTFYISTTITLDPLFGRNRSPILTAPAVDKAGVNQVFLHNPAAFDPDGDSLAFHLRTSQQVPAGIDGTLGPPCAGATGNNKPVPQTTTNFRYPNDPAITGPGNPPRQVPYEGVPAGVPGSPAIFEQDPFTGQITWNAPVAIGFYNVALVVEEWRRTPGGRQADRGGDPRHADHRGRHGQPAADDHGAGRHLRGGRRAGDGAGDGRRRVLAAEPGHGRSPCSPTRASCPRPRLRRRRPARRRPGARSRGRPSAGTWRACRTWSCSRPRTRATRR
jgi:hypothetical protein